MAASVEPRKHMARNYRDGSKRTTGHVDDTRHEAKGCELSIASAEERRPPRVEVPRILPGLRHPQHFRIRP